MKTVGIPPVTTWHSQQGLLYVSAFWGLSYLIPPVTPPRFAEILGAGPISMFGWGIILILATLVAYGTKEIGSRCSSPGWVWSLNYGSHMVLGGVYAAQAVSSLIEGLGEINTPPTTMAFWGNVISSVGRTLLWGFLSYLHSTYARLPRPAAVEVDQR